MSNRETAIALTAALRAAGMDQEAVAQALRARKEVIKGASRRSSSTAEKYAKAYARMRDGKSMPAKATNKETFYFRRAAWNVGVAHAFEIAFDVFHENLLLENGIRPY